MFGCGKSIDLDSLAINEVPRALNFLPMAHMFGMGTVVAITYLGKIKIHLKKKKKKYLFVKFYRW
jgi:long-subunit acyl-CoA synthetase (AMP-forming)